ncbi:phenylalanine--tRNA ligase subunit beta [Williamsoniiplasma luminosum]|uniref:Phenylalanine--tRNA ligase beta subunit n=1 Tax=Williamsoniiplasma luminosum TaxID=214888 RepID=A0A2S0NJ25_9MOLU|nr:phenylalanine--tRNA ligase subunit beta [Williamsoniiplasma luminosum]AVP49015.1 MAG: phenylalanine--tRNA ligase subunit beta [Williamsoniiplasma luminosum]
MILTRNWLSKFLNLESIKNADISKALNALGFEVEAETNFANLNTELIIGYVEQSHKIPDTHLSFNHVNIGTNTPLEIVCGGANVGPGQFVVIAPVGATIANGLTMGERIIKGYKSQGMICALNEIGIPNSALNEAEQDLIYVIHSDQELMHLLGKSFAEIGYDDYAWEVDLTLNRNDALASLQLLKEIANFFNLKIKNPYSKEVKTNLLPNPKIQFQISKKLEQQINTLTCQRYQIHQELKNLNVIDDLWLKINGHKAMENPIENLAMLATIQTGQPTILIDQDKIEEILKLDFVKHEDKEVLALISNHEIVQIIGLPTAKQFAVDASTTKILAIRLNFKPTIMRQQQKHLNLSNANLQRYMKPLNPNLFELSDQVLTHLLAQYKILAAKSSHHLIIKAPPTNTKFILTLEEIKNILGFELKAHQIKKLFKTLDFKVKTETKKITFYTDPNRVDIYGANDLCEEIARLYGYDKIQEVPLVIQANASVDKTKPNLEAKIGHYLIGAGFNNIKTYSLIPSDKNDQWNLFNLKQPVVLNSPLSQAHEVYRMNLASSIVETAIYNSVNNNKRLKLWEIADVYTRNLRQRHLSMLVTGEIVQEPIVKNDLDNNYFYLKGMVDAILAFYRIDPLSISFKETKPSNNATHPFINAEITIDQKTIGFIFKLNPKFENANKIKPTFVVELNLDLLFELANKNILFAPIAKFQSSSRDVSLILPDYVMYQELTQNLLNDVQYVASYKLMGEYQNEEMKTNNEKSITLSFVFNHLDEQLTEAEINQEWNQVLANIGKMKLKVR